MSISSTFINWYLQKKRNLPWRNSQNPYEIWVSEVILQQTRVAQGIGYYHRFLTSFPTLESLANEISLNPRILSQIINETYKKNFKSYILEYRIKESMQILADSKHSKHTILEILYQVGFNSKSAFNNQFKIYTNLTPIEYRSKTIG